MLNFVLLKDNNGLVYLSPRFIIYYYFEFLEINKYANSNWNLRIIRIHYKIKDLYNISLLKRIYTMSYWFISFWDRS